MKPVIRALAAALIAFAFVFGPARAQEMQAPAAALVGVWLIEPEHYDLLIEQGIDVTRFPVLMLRADAAFSLYHLHFSCYARDEAGRRVGEPGGPSAGDEEAFCTREAAASAAEIGFEHARRFAAGTFNVISGDSTRVTFTTSYRLQPETDVARLLNEFRSLSAGGGALGRVLQELWRPPFLEPGAVVTVERAGRVLALRVEGAEVRFRRYDREALAGAATLTDRLGVFPQHYFRCTLAAVDSVFGKEAAARTEAERDLADLVAVASEIAALQRSLLASPPGSLSPTEVAQTRQRAADLGARLAASRYDAAAQEGRLGRALGCPDRDGR